MTVATLPAPLTPAAATSARPVRGTRSRPSTRPRPKLGPAGRGPHPLQPPTGLQGAPIRLTRRGRAAAALLGLVAVALVGLGLLTAFTPSHGDAVGHRTVTVIPGQSAWDVARDVNPSVDPRVTIEAVTTLNGLESAGSIEPGQRLLVPVYTAG